MANFRNDWQGMLKFANDDLKQHNTAICVDKDEDDGYYSISILYGVDFDTAKHEKYEIFADTLFESELSGVVTGAWHYALQEIRNSKKM